MLFLIVICFLNFVFLFVVFLSFLFFVVFLLYQNPCFAIYSFHNFMFLFKLVLCIIVFCCLKNKLHFQQIASAKWSPSRHLSIQSLQIIVVRHIYLFWRIVMEFRQLYFSYHPVLFLSIEHKCFGVCSSHMEPVSASTYFWVQSRGNSSMCEGPTQSKRPAPFEAAEGRILDVG